MKATKKDIQNIIHQIMDDLDIYVHDSTKSVISGNIIDYIKGIENEYIEEKRILREEIKNISFEYRELKRVNKTLLGILGK